MSEHNFEIGDVVELVDHFNSIITGIVKQVYEKGVLVRFSCGEFIYIPNYMLYVLHHVDQARNTFIQYPKAEQFNKNKDQQMKEQNVKPKNIKPEDEVTITVTYRDLAKMYALLGSVSCAHSDHRLFYRLEKMLDPSGDIRDSVVVNNISSGNRLKYKEYQEEFESALFPEPVETEQQKQIRELREQAEAMQEQSNALLQKARDLEESQN